MFDTRPIVVLNKICVGPNRLNHYVLGRTITDKLHRFVYHQAFLIEARLDQNSVVGIRSFDGLGYGDVVGSTHGVHHSRSRASFFLFNLFQVLQVVFHRLETRLIPGLKPRLKLGLGRRCLTPALIPFQARHPFHGHTD
jgi:hypothetical protein